MCGLRNRSLATDVRGQSIFGRWHWHFDPSIYRWRIYTETLRIWVHGTALLCVRPSCTEQSTRLPLYHQQFVKLTACIRLSASSKHICLHYVFTARCTLVQSAVLRSHVVCLSVRPSVTLVDCDHICWNLSKIVSRLVSLGCSLSADPNIRGSIPRGTPGNLGPKSHPLLIWASETFDRNCGRMVTDIATVTVESL